MAFTVQERVCLVESYFKTESFDITNTDLCRLCGCSNVPMKSVIRKRVKIFTETGFSCVVKRVRPLTLMTESSNTG
jgi:hypothetical protein